MAEIEANDGFCGQICGRISEMTTRNFWLKTDVKKGRETIPEIFMVRFVVSRAGRGLVFCGERGGFRRLIKSAKFLRQRTTNNENYLAKKKIVQRQRGKEICPGGKRMEFKPID